MFVIAYPRETQERVLDAPNQAFAFFGDVPKRMVYDNLKTVVDAIFVGKERRFNRRFLALANHYLFEPVACTPESGWEKGQVENQEGQIIAEHTRQWGRDQLVCDPWHSLPILEKKPGALRHGRPFQDWDLPVSIQGVRDRLLKQPKGGQSLC
jgi:hypothetical protein